MKRVSFEEAEKNFKKIIDEVVETKESVLITRDNKKDCIVLLYETYASLQDEVQKMIDLLEKKE